jgi:hypothetical protein
VPERGLASQDAQEIAGDQRPLNALEGSIRGAHGEVARLINRRGLEHAAIQLAVVEELRGRDAAAHARVHLRQSFLDDHDAIRVAVRQRPDQDAVDDREDRAVGADAQREAEDHGDGQHRRAAQGAKGEAQVLCEHGEILLALRASHAAFVRGATITSERVYISEPTKRFVPRCLGRPAARDEVFHLGVHVKAEFLIEVGVDVTPPEAEIPAPRRRRHG